MPTPRHAPAKINLCLAVGPARPSDGYHPIASWMAPIDLCDEVTVDRLADGQPSRFEVRWAPDAPRPTPIDWPADRDLTARAHALLEREAGRALPVAMTVTKRIPVGAGLGGGSSDAAAALLAVRDAFDLPISDERLRTIGLSVGSDVPFFARRPLTPALVTGLGDHVEPAPAPSGAAGVVVLVPPFGCATRAVYKAFDFLPAPPFAQDRAARLARSGVVRDDELFNDLTDAAERVAPALVALRDRAVLAASRPALLTGSGSALCFLAMSDRDAEGIAAALRESMRDCAAVYCRFTGQQ